MLVCLFRAVRSAFHLKTVKGRVQILHSIYHSESVLVGNVWYEEFTYAMIFLQHLDVGILRQAIFADRREIRRLPARAIKILLDLGRHIEFQDLTKAKC